MDPYEGLDEVEALLKYDLIQNFESKRKQIFTKLFSAALGSIPWVGGYLSGLSDLLANNSQDKNNRLYQEWLEEHSRKMRDLVETMAQVMKRLDEFSESINERIESEEYLQIVRKAFRAWDNSDTLEKKELIRKLLTNSGTNKLVPDDLIRLFLDWINTYHEVHFAVIKAVFQSPGITRYEIWQELNGSEVREDSLEADLFKLLIRDLSTGSVIRQHRLTNYDGSFIKRTPKRSVNASRTLKSAFDDQESYELTELGKQFVHYTMNEVVPRLG